VYIAEGRPGKPEQAKQATIPESLQQLDRADRFGGGRKSEAHITRTDLAGAQEEQLPAWTRPVCHGRFHG
ncbi:unnamed protein product, partial [Symbiodinium sp. CCMP2456]